MSTGSGCRIVRISRPQIFVPARKPTLKDGKDSILKAVNNAEAVATSIIDLLKKSSDERITYQKTLEAFRSRALIRPQVPDELLRCTSGGTG